MADAKQPQQPRQPARPATASSATSRGSVSAQRPAPARLTDPAQQARTNPQPTQEPQQPNRPTEYRNLAQMAREGLNPGQAFFARFGKRTAAGAERSGRFRVPVSPGTGRGLSFDPVRYNLLHVDDLDKGEPRFINLDALYELRQQGKVFKPWSGSNPDLPRSERSFAKTAGRNFYPAGMAPDEPGLNPHSDMRGPAGVARLRRAIRDGNWGRYARGQGRPQRLRQFEEDAMNRQVFSAIGAVERDPGRVSHFTPRRRKRSRMAQLFGLDESQYFVAPALAMAGRAAAGRGAGGMMARQAAMGGGGPQQPPMPQQGSGGLPIGPDQEFAQGNALPYPEYNAAMSTEPREPFQPTYETERADNPQYTEPTTAESQRTSREELGSTKHLRGILHTMESRNRGKGLLQMPSLDDGFPRFRVDPLSVAGIRRNIPSRRSRYRGRSQGGLNFSWNDDDQQNQQQQTPGMIGLGQPGLAIGERRQEFGGGGPNIPSALVDAANGAIGGGVRAAGSIARSYNPAGTYKALRRAGRGRMLSAAGAAAGTILDSTVAPGPLGSMAVRRLLGRGKKVDPAPAPDADDQHFARNDWSRRADEAIGRERSQPTMESAYARDADERMESQSRRDRAANAAAGWYDPNGPLAEKPAPRRAASEAPAPRTRGRVSASVQTRRQTSPPPLSPKIAEIERAEIARQEASRSRSKSELPADYGDRPPGAAAAAARVRSGSDMPSRRSGATVRIGGDALNPQVQLRTGSRGRPKAFAGLTPKAAERAYAKLAADPTSPADLLRNVQPRRTNAIIPSPRRQSAADPIFRRAGAQPRQQQPRLPAPPVDQLARIRTPLAAYARAFRPAGARPMASQRLLTAGSTGATMPLSVPARGGSLAAAGRRGPVATASAGQPRLSGSPAQRLLTGTATASIPTALRQQSARPSVEVVGATANAPSGRPRLGGGSRTNRIAQRLGLNDAFTGSVGRQAASLERRFAPRSAVSGGTFTPAGAGQRSPVSGGTFTPAQPTVDATPARILSGQRGVRGSEIYGDRLRGLQGGLAGYRPGMRRILGLQGIGVNRRGQLRGVRAPQGIMDRLLNRPRGFVNGSPFGGRAIPVQGTRSFNPQRRNRMIRRFSDLES